VSCRGLQARRTFGPLALIGDASVPSPESAARGWNLQTSAVGPPIADFARFQQVSHRSRARVAGRRSCAPLLESTEKPCLGAKKSLSGGARSALRGNRRLSSPIPDPVERRPNWPKQTATTAAMQHRKMGGPESNW
jgi:hypothetical protein